MAQTSSMHPTARRGGALPPAVMAVPALALAAVLAATAPAAAQDGAERALAALDGSGGEGELSLFGNLLLGQTAAGEPRGLAEILVRVGDALRAPGVRALRVTLVLGSIDAEPLVLVEEVPLPDLSTATAWVYQRELELPQDFVDAAAAVETVGGDAWGATALAFDDEPLPRPFTGVVVHTTRLGAPEPPPAAASPETARRPSQPGPIRLLRPREEPATGTLRFQTVTSDVHIDRVTFLLDGVEVAEDDRPPFGARIDLGPEVAVREVQVVAYSGSGRVLGEDSIRLNDATQPFRVAIAGLDGDGSSGSVEVEARVSVPPGAELDRVEFYWNEELGATLSAPPFRARLTRDEPGPQDYVRVVAHLADGSANEDAWLLSAPGPSERIEVNLVEVYAVVTDREGKPVEDLSRDDFTVLLDGRELGVESFGPAEAVPLVLGVVIDTSESMYPLMIDTKQAGAQFLLETVRDEDRAFLVDFDTRPRLAHAVTDDVADLLRAFGRLQAEGFTALYDAVIFGLVQLEELPGRKALVLLTDGDDYRSEFGQGRSIEYARDVGAPVYIIGLAGIHDPRRGLRKIELEGLTEATGGRIFYIDEIAGLADAYARINAELRTQYLLTFATERQLTTAELRSIRVKVRGRGLSVRHIAVGRSGE